MLILILLPLLVTFAGAYMLIRLRAFFILHPIKTLRAGAHALKDRDVRSSFILALAGTLGVGNIFGVAMGIILGGAGSVFWLMISALFSCVLKYSEVLMSASYKKDPCTEKDITDLGGSKKRGRSGSVLCEKSAIKCTDPSADGEIKSSELGTPLSIKKAFARSGMFLSLLYSALCLALALVMGASLQSRSISGTIEATLGTSRLIIAPMLVIIVLILTRGGAEKIEQTTRKLIPLSTMIYISATFFVIFSNFSHIPAAITEIISSAFSLKSAASGVLSFAFLSALREGYARGIMSNEAGVGTSSFAHSRERGITPAESGILGILEVLFDTVFICGITGLAIVISVPDSAAYTSGMSLVLAAFSPLGQYAAPMLIFCVFCFALSSVVCWYFYGDESRKNLFGNKGRRIYAAAFILAAGLGVFLPDGFSVRFTDIILLFMSLPTLAAIIKSSDRIVRLSELGKYKNSKKPRRIKKRSKQPDPGKNCAAAVRKS